MAHFFVVFVICCSGYQVLLFIESGNQPYEKHTQSLRSDDDEDKDIGGSAALNLGPDSDNHDGGNDQPPKDLLKPSLSTFSLTF